MTSQSPRIYTYKITFEEVPYYYYGSKKEKRFNEEYWGSPVTNKWCWELYTPKKQILEFFDFTDEGYEECIAIETRLIQPVLNDPYCLNERCGRQVSLNVCRKSGEKHYENGTGCFSLTNEERIELSRKTGKKLYEEGKGIHSQTTEERRKMGQKLHKERKGIHAQTFEERSELGKRNGKKNYEEKKGIHVQTFEDHSEKGKKLRDEGKGIFSLTIEEKRQIVKKNYEEKKGIFSLTSEQMSETCKKVAAQRWMCTETGFITNSGCLSQYQKARGIDTSKRVRIS
jgi:hypothetical protein